MLKILLKKQFAEMFRTYFYNAKKNTARSRGTTVGYIIIFVLIMVVLLGGMFTILSVSICGALSSAGMDWLYFAIMGLLSIFFGAFGSVFNTYSGLYLAKDNELLLSMPIPVSTVMAARLLGVYLMGLMYSAVIIVPAVIVYWVLASASISSIICGILFVAFISIFVLTISCALGWVVAKISLKLKNKSIITVIISLVCIGAYYFFYFKAQSIIADLIANAYEYGMKIKGAAYPVYVFGRAATGNWLSMLAVAVVFIALFLIMWALISRSFLKIATASGNTAKKAYREKAVKQTGIGHALLKKEFGRFVSSPTYMLNCGLGVLLLPICGVLLLVKGGMVISSMNMIFVGKSGSIAVLFCAAVCIVASMNDMTTPSVSLEGKSLWLIQSLPVMPWQALRAKLSVQLILTGIPALFCIVCMAVIYPLPPVQLLFMTLVVLAYILFMALFGLLLGIKMPNLTWTNEITPIKQNISVIIAMFGGMIYAALIAGAFLLFGWRMGFAAYMICVLAVTLVLAAVTCRWLKTAGSSLFAHL